MTDLPETNKCPGCITCTKPPLNQCDGCLAGDPLIKGLHERIVKGGYRDLQSCTKHLYASTPGCGGCVKE
jgi:hypothetical protein